MRRLDYLNTIHYKSKAWRDKPEVKIKEPFFFDDQRERFWREVFSVIDFFATSKKAELKTLKERFPECKRLNSILRNLSDDNAFLILHKKRKFWYFVGKIGCDSTWKEKTT